jgi:hypothetical protein
MMFALWSVLAFLAVRAEAATLFDASPAHPWNRLYQALQGTPPSNQDRFPAGPRREVFPDDQEYAELVAALDAFIKAHAEKLIATPIKRAVMESLVWATFDQSSDPTASRQSERDQVAQRCAAIIRRLALTDAEIDALPDNYAAAVKAKTFATEFQAAHPDAEFLPTDLFDGKSSWVMMSGEWPDPAAVQHVRVVQGRSQFYVFIRLPGDRAATLAYLHALANYPQPYAWNEQYSSQPYNLSPVKLNPALPEFPKGTTVALLRRMILPNSNGELRVTRITESLQLRVYSMDPKDVQCCDDVGQRFYAIRQDLTSLFQGTGGLVLAGRDEDFTPLLFETPSLLLVGNACRGCHGDTGVQSFNTYTRRLGPPRHTPWFEPALPESQDMETLEWKQRQYTWGLLRGMLMSTGAAASR